MRIHHFLIGIVLSIVFVQCAQVRPINGGEKDTEAPKVLGSSPTNFSTGFNGNTIMLEFDEYVVVGDLNSEMIVSPPLEHPVEYTIKGKRVYIELGDTLKENTTYNFYFGNSIKDLNEGNPLDSNLFAFSTGAVLDSGQISGKVMDAYTQKPVAATVLLYPSHRDSAIFEGKPAYITKSDKSGNYSLKYLSEGTYQIYVLEQPGPEKEYVPFTKIGIYPTLLHPNPEEPINFNIFAEEDTLQYLSRSKATDYFAFVASFHSPLKNPKFEFDRTGDSVNIVVHEMEPDSFKFWVVGDLALDSVFMRVSDETGYMDTIYQDLKSREDYYKSKRKNKTVELPSLGIKLNTASNQFDYFDSLEFRFSRPVTDWDPTKIMYVSSSDTTRLDSAINARGMSYVFPSKNIGTTEELLRMRIRNTWEPNSQYAFIFYPGAFTDVLKTTNDTIVRKFTTRAFEDYGSFRMKVVVPDYDGNIVVELLDQKGEYLRSYYLKSGDDIYHELARPGKYKFRLILDENGNKKWDTGSLSRHQQAETIVYHPDVIEIRPNWDMEEVWNVHLH